MSKIVEHIQQFGVMISDHGNAALSKGIHYFGITSLVGGGGTSLAQKTGIIQADPSWHLSDIGILVSIVGGVTLIIKNLVDTYFSIKRGRSKEDQE